MYSTEQLGFFIDEDTTEIKQHLNLTAETWAIIDADIDCFYGTLVNKKSNFLNRVFRNFYQKADATISLRLNEKEEELEDLYSSSQFKGVDKKVINLFIKKSLDAYETELIKKSKSYKSGIGYKFRIDKESIEILKELVDDGDYYFNTIGLYLKPLFEEYASMPAHLREQIFFSDTIDEINKAINNKRKLKLTQIERVNVLGNKTRVDKYYVTPYKIAQDSSYMYNYLIGYSEKIVDIISENENGEQSKTSTVTERSISCFRIARISKISCQSSMHASLSKAEVEEFEQAILERGTMFIARECEDVVVRFTEKGLEAFKRQLFMRPCHYTIDPDDKYLYTFHCPLQQARNYLFKFGWDAYIVSPVEEQERFRKMYSRSYKSYLGMSKDEIFASEKTEENK